MGTEMRTEMRSARGWMQSGPREVALGVVTAWVALAGSMTGCVAPIDTLGHQTIVKEEASTSKEAVLEDDKIEDKHPVYDEALFFPEQLRGNMGDLCDLEVNKSGAVASLDVVPFQGDAAAVNDALYPTRTAALTALDTLPGADPIPSMEVINAGAKAFNDGLYAAIELGAERGVEGDGRAAGPGAQATLVGKRALLRGLADALVAAAAGASDAQRPFVEEAAQFVIAALILGAGDTARLPDPLVAAAGADAENFRSQSQIARPLGFYDWSEELRQVFRQDRFLQAQHLRGQTTSLEGRFGMFVAMAAVLEGDADLTTAYERLLDIYRGLTNPYVAYPLTALFDAVDGLGSLDDLDATRQAFLASHPARFPCPGSYPYLAVLPASASKDTALYDARYCGAPPPAGESFLDVLIAAIRDGSLDVSPDDASGWYDYQLWALETLLLPDRAAESDHLLLSAGYKKKLIDSFKSILTQTRETHVKQLQGGMAGSAMPASEVDIYPLFPVEPFPTYYLRTARGYRFLRTYLQAVLGVPFLDAQRRVYADGSRGEVGLDAALGAMAQRMYGLYLLSARSVGMDPAAQLLPEELGDMDTEAALAAARGWLEAWQEDPDVTADARVIVPVGAAGDEMIYWAVIGVRAIQAHTAFVEGFEPRVRIPDDAQSFCEVRDFVPHDYQLLVEDMVEVRLSADTPPPTRAELRALCDEHQTHDAIVAALEAL